MFFLKHSVNPITNFYYNCTIAAAPPEMAIDTGTIHRVLQTGRNQSFSAGRLGMTIGNQAHTAEAFHGRAEFIQYFLRSVFFASENYHNVFIGYQHIIGIADASRSDTAYILENGISAHFGSFQ